MFQIQTSIGMIFIQYNCALQEEHDSKTRILFVNYNPVMIVDYICN